MMYRYLLAVLLAGVAASGPANADTLESIHAAGYLKCGTIESVDDWNGQDQHGDLSSLGGEICRAVAIAIFGDHAKVEIVRFPAEPEALSALKNGDVALAVGVTPGTEVAVQYNVAFGPPVLFDTQRLMVPQSSGVRSVADLNDKLICAMNNTPAERTLREEMTTRGIPYGLQAHSEQGEMDASVAVARCAAGSALETRLADSRADFPANAPPFVFLPERFGIEPVVPAYRYGDHRFGLIVDWTVNALIEAESVGVTQANVSNAMKRTDLRSERLLGRDRAVAQALGLRPDWAADVIAVTGNYGEIFERTVGKTYRLERGFNALWTDGGLMYPQPMQ
jgi:general L-amino acid transport system substrate-binding protein